MKTVYTDESTLPKGKTLVVKAALWLLRKAWNRKELLSVAIQKDYESAFCLVNKKYVLNYSAKEADK